MGQTVHWHWNSLSVWCSGNPMRVTQQGSFPPSLQHCAVGGVGHSFTAKDLRRHRVPRWLRAEDSAANAGDTGEGGSIPGGGGPLEESIETHSSVRAWRIPRTEELRRRQYVGLQESQTWLSRWALMVMARVPTVVGGWAVSLRRPVMCGVTG